MFKNNLFGVTIEHLQAILSNIPSEVEVTNLFFIGKSQNCDNIKTN